MKVLDLIKMVRDAGINENGNYIFNCLMTHMRQCKPTLDFALENPTEMQIFILLYIRAPLFKQVRLFNTPLPQTYGDIVNTLTKLLIYQMII